MEVMIGMAILTIAIVAATSILIALINSNKNITKTLQAYNLAQEGIEAVRNIRDTNWLNNLEYLGEDTSTIWPKLAVGGTYAIFVDISKMGQGNDGMIPAGSDASSLGQFSPWILEPVSGDNIRICLWNGYFSNCDGCDPTTGCTQTDFSRVISINKYCYDTNYPERDNENVCEDSTEDSPKAIRVTSTVMFGGKSVSLDTVLTDWKTNPL